MNNHHNRICLTSQNLDLASSVVGTNHKNILPNGGLSMVIYQGRTRQKITEQIQGHVFVVGFFSVGKTEISSKYQLAPQFLVGIFQGETFHELYFERNV